jgi:hypothetical protein
MAIVSGLSAGLLAILLNPQVRPVLMGFGVKAATDQLKKLFKKVDENGVLQGYKVPLQLVVIVSSGVASLAELALTGQLSTYNVDALVNFITVALPVYLNAMGIHFGAKIAANELKKNKESGGETTGNAKK